MDKAMCRENVGVILLVLDKYQNWCHTSQKGENGFQRSLSHPVIPYSASCFQMVPPNYTLWESSISFITTELLSKYPNKWTSICPFFLQSRNSVLDYAFLFLMILVPIFEQFLKMESLRNKNTWLTSRFTLWLWWTVSHRGAIPLPKVKDWLGDLQLTPTSVTKGHTNVETVDKGPASN